MVWTGISECNWTVGVFHHEHRSVGLGRAVTFHILLIILDKLWMFSTYCTIKLFMCDSDWSLSHSLASWEKKTRAMLQKALNQRVILAMFI